MTGLKIIDGTPTELSKYLREREERFNLSEKIIREDFGRLDSILIKDVKEFIRLVEEQVIAGNPNSRQMLIKLKNLVGKEERK